MNRIAIANELVKVSKLLSAANEDLLYNKIRAWIGREMQFSHFYRSQIPDAVDYAMHYWERKFKALGFDEAEAKDALTDLITEAFEP